jgi:hypothetical protein
MKAPVKLLISLAATIVCGWVVHGPLGQGAAFVDGLQARAEAAIRDSGLTDVRVAFGRDPLSRAALLSGQANDFQRNGMGLLPGLTGRVAAVPGVGAVHWNDEAAAGRAVPLIAETEALAVLAWLIGIGIGRLVFGRRKRAGYL